MVTLYANADLSTGLNDGTSEANAFYDTTNFNISNGDTVYFKAVSVPFYFPVGYSSSFDTTVTEDLNGFPGWVGYSTVIEDGGIADILIADNKSLYIDLNLQYYRLANLNVSGNYSYQAIFRTGSGTFCYMDSCVITNNYPGTNVASKGVEVYSGAITNSDIISLGSSSCGLSMYKGTCVGNRIRTAGTRGIWVNQAYNSSLVANNLVIATNPTNALYGLYLTGGSNDSGNLISNNTFDGFPTAIYTDQVPTFDHTEQTNVFGNLFGGFTIAMDSISANTAGLHVLDNAFYGPEAYSPFEPEILLTSDPFADAVNGDYSLNSVAGGGAEIANKYALVNRSIGAIGHNSDAAAPSISPSAILMMI